MADIPYAGGVPTVAPDVQQPDDYERIQSSPANFGGLIAQGGEKLGAATHDVSKFWAEVQVDGQLNDSMKQLNDLAEHAKSLQGQEALDNQADIQKQAGDIVASGRSRLGSPDQQLRYDNTMRPFADRYIAGQLSTHFVQQAYNHAQQVNDGAFNLSLNNTANSYDNPEEVEKFRQDARSALTKKVHADGNDGDPTIVKAAWAKADQAVYKTQIEATLANDPARGAIKAQQLLSQHKDALGDAYAPLAERINTKVTKQEGQALGLQKVEESRYPPVDSGDAAGLIKHFEGYRSQPYWDVNHWRVGYGSDTVTRADGTIEPVTAMTKVTQADAERDVQRRTQLSASQAQVASGEGWAALPAPTRASLTSVAYNYGRMPDSVAAAAKTGDPGLVARSISGLQGANGGVNANRRQIEAANALGQFTIPGGPSVLPAGGRTMQIPRGNLQPPPQPDFNRAMQAVYDDPTTSFDTKLEAMRTVNEQKTMLSGQTATERQSLKTSIPDLISAYENGDESSPWPADRISAVFPPALAQHYNDEFQAARHVGTILGGLRYASQDEVGAAVQDLNSGTGVLSTMMKVHARAGVTGPGSTPEEGQALEAESSFRLRAGAAAKLGKILNERNEALYGPNADPAAYVAQEPTVAATAALAQKDKSVTSAAVSASLGIQDHLGVPPEQQRVLTRGQALQLAHGMMQPGTDVLGQLNSLKDQYGQNYDKVFKDLSTLGKLPSTYRAVAALPDSNDAGLLARALQEGPGGSSKEALNKSWQDSLSVATNDKKASTTIDSSIESAPDLMKYANSLAAQGLSKGMIDDITSDVKTLAYAKVYWGHEPLASAGQSAVNAFTSQFSFDLPGGPRVPATKAALVNSDAIAMLQDLSPDRVMIPPGVGGHGQASAADYLNSVRYAPMWTNNQDATGLNVKGPDGRFVRGLDGKPLTLSFADAGKAAANAAVRGPYAPAAPAEVTALQRQVDLVGQRLGGR